MITFKNELPMDHEKSIQHIVSSWSIDMYEHDKEMGVVKPNLDYCTETSWSSIEEHLESEGLKMECIV